MDWKHYNVHWVHTDGTKRKTCFTALSKEDARNTFNEYAAVKGNSYGIPLGTKPTKVIGPLGIHPQTPKQKLAQQYRSCIGALKMAEKSIIYVGVVHTDPKEMYKRASLRTGATKHLQNSMRDVKDLFKCLGLNIK